MNSAKVFEAAYIFNFFTRPVTPHLQGGLQYWADAGDKIYNYHKEQGNPDIFLSTHLHMSVNPNSTNQLFNFGVFKNFDAFPFMISKNPKVAMALRGGGKPVTKANPGGYVELKGLSRESTDPVQDKGTPDDYRFIVTSFIFAADNPTAPGPPPCKFPDTTNAAMVEFDSNWADVSGANQFASLDLDNDISGIYLYKRETHGLVSYVLRAIIPEGADKEDKANTLIEKMRSFYDGNEFLKSNNISADCDLYRVIINGNGEKYFPNEFGIGN